MKWASLSGFYIGILALQTVAFALPNDLIRVEVATESQYHDIQAIDTSPPVENLKIIQPVEELETRAKKNTKPKPKPASPAKPKQPGQPQAKPPAQPAKPKPPIQPAKPKPSTTKGKPGATPKPTPAGKPLHPWGTCGQKKRDESRHEKLSGEIEDVNATTNVFKRDQKILVVGGVQLKFPTHPTSGEAIKAARYRTLIQAFGTKKARPCDDDYALVKLPFPKTQGESLNDELWNTEHVMDAQIVQGFFESVVAKKKPQPSSWLFKSGTTKVPAPTMENYLKEFWNLRPVNNVPAMEYLLREYPGTHQYKNELLFLGSSINIKKEHIFGFPRGDCVAARKWRDLSFNQRVNEVRECLLLIMYINTDAFQNSFAQVATRIKKRLVDMEKRPSGFLQQTDNYYARLKKNPSLNDAPGETWQDLQLSVNWETWVKALMKDRLFQLNRWVTDHANEVKRWAQDIQKDKTLSQQQKRRHYDRAVAMQSAFKSIRSVTNPKW